MTFILGSILFLLGGFFGMLIMAFAQAVSVNYKKQQEDDIFGRFLND